MSAIQKSAGAQRPDPRGGEGIRAGANRQERDPFALMEIERAPDGLDLVPDEEANQFHIPPAIIARFEAAGWSLEWKRLEVFGQQDINYNNKLARGRWQAVTTDEAPSLMPDGYRGAVIIGGLQLMKRPMYLTIQARKEQRQAAKALVQSKEAQLGQAPDGTLTRDHKEVRPKIGKTFEPVPIPGDEEE